MGHGRPAAGMVVGENPVLITASFRSHTAFNHLGVAESCHIAANGWASATTAGSRFTCWKNISWWPENTEQLAAREPDYLGPRR